MAGPPPPVSVVRVEILGDNYGQSWANIFHVLTEPTGTVSSSDVSELANAFFSAYTDNFLGLMSAGCGALSCMASYSLGDGTFVDGVFASPSGGTDTGPTLTADVSILGSWQVSSQWRGGHPRTYIPGAVQDRLLDSHTYSTATISEAQTDFEDFLSAVNLLTPTGFSSVTLGCLRRFADGGSVATPKVYLDPPEFVAYSGVLVRKTPGIQRRRLIS